MCKLKITMDIKALFTKYKLGTIVQEPVNIPGGLIHKMFRVTTATDTYAVKLLNPSIMQRKGVMEHMINSELIATAFSKHLSVVAALCIDGQTVLHFKHNDYMVFHWIDGASVFPPFINEMHCYKIGCALGRIHQVNLAVPKVKKENQESILYDWNQFIVNMKDTETFWFDAYAKVIDKLITWNTLVNEANHKLSENMVISHRDLDPKNVMWHQDIPYIIDWEAAGYVNPYQELLEVLNYWTNDGDGNLDKNKFIILLNAYSEYMSIKDVDWDCVLNSGYSGMLGWLHYSLKRASGLEGTGEEEQKLGEEQVIETIKELKRYDNQLNMIRSWLK